MAIRTTVQLDEDIVDRVRRHIAAQDLRQFVNEAVATRVEQLEREEVQEAMREGYVATRGDRDDLSKDWAPVDAEGWPD